MIVKRALTVHDLKAYQARVLPFEGAWLAAIGRPELRGSWIIWGNPANGKTRFALQLAKYLANFVRVAYDTLEEGLSLSIKEAVMGCAMQDVSRSFTLLDQEPIPELITRLRRKRSPNVVVIDSLQYTGMSYGEYKRLRDSFPGKLFIFVSHADGREPKGNVAKSVRYDAFVKVYVEGYRAFAQSRYGGGEPFTIWEKGSNDYWNYK
jgi:hypothetical protein